MSPETSNLETTGLEKWKEERENIKIDEKIDPEAHIYLDLKR